MLKEPFRFREYSPAFPGVEDCPPEDPEDNPRPKIVAVVEFFDSIHNFLLAQAGILKVGRLMTVFIRYVNKKLISNIYAFMIPYVRRIL